MLQRGKEKMTLRTMKNERNIPDTLVLQVPSSHVCPQKRRLGVIGGKGVRVAAVTLEFGVTVFLRREVELEFNSYWS
jgi:hypothetical protein